MKSDQGSKFGGFSNIGWEERPKNKGEYPIDDNSFLFSLDTKKIFNAIKGKSKICWINSDIGGLFFYGTLGIYKNFLNELESSYYSDENFSSTFENCSKKDFNSGNIPCIFSEVEIFQIT